MCKGFARFKNDWLDLYEYLSCPTGPIFRELSEISLGVEKGTSPCGRIRDTLMHIYRILIISQAISLKCHVKIRHNHKYKYFPCTADAELMKTSQCDSVLLVLHTLITIQVLSSLHSRHLILHPSLVCLTEQELAVQTAEFT